MVMRPEVAWERADCGNAISGRGVFSESGRASAPNAVIGNRSKRRESRLSSDFVFYVGFHSQAVVLNALSRWSIECSRFVVHPSYQ